MKRQNRNSSVEASVRYKVPKINVVNQSFLSTMSPSSNSFCSGMNQGVFSLGPLLGLRNLQKLSKGQSKCLSTGGVVLSRSRKPEFCAKDIEYLEEYR